MYSDRSDLSARSSRRWNGLKRSTGILALAVAATIPLISNSPVHANKLSEVDQALIAFADNLKPTDSELLSQGTDQYKQGKYEEAQVTLQQIKVEGLSASDQQKLRETLGNVESALNERKTARSEFEKGEKLLNEDKNPAEAMSHYRAAANNKFADEATKNKATSQIAVAEASMKAAPAPVEEGGGATDQKGMYKEAVNDYKAGRYEAARRKFAELQSKGYKGGLFDRKPGEFLRDIDKKMAEGIAVAAEAQQPAPVVQPVQPKPQPQPQPVRPVPLPVPVPVQPAGPTMDQALRQQVTSEINSARARMTAAQQRKANGAPQFAQATQALADANTRSATAKSNDDLRTALAAAQNAALLFDAAAAPTIVTTTTVPQPSRPTTASTLVLGDTTKRVRSALQHYFNGDFDEAARGFQSLTNDLPNNGWIYAFLGASQYSVYAFETDENYKTLAMDSFKKARRYGKFKAGLPPKYFSRRIRKAFDTVAN